ncbi:Flp pilus assembly protein CpaB [Mariniluteicoccus flavus]
MTHLFRSPEPSRTPTPARGQGPWRPAPSSPLRAPARVIARHRRALAALAAGLSVAAAVGAISPGPPPTHPVVVAARPVTAGAALAADDLMIAHYPTGLGPADAISDPARLVGRPAVTGLAPGSPVTAATVVSPDSLRASPGRALVPVRLADPTTTQLVRPGDRVDVLALPTDGQPAKVVARGARVAALPGRSAPPGPLGGDDGSASATILFEVDHEAAPALAQAASMTRLSIILRGT